MHIHEDEVCCCLRASMRDSNAPIAVIYDARGNGGGAVCPTITGDHQDRITDYTAIVVQHEETLQSSKA